MYALYMQMHVSDVGEVYVRKKGFSLPACENMKTLRRILTGNLQRLAILQHLPRYQEYLAFGDEDLLKGIVGGVKEDGIMFRCSLLSYDSLDHKESNIAPLSLLDEHKVEEKQKRNLS